jgi:hypothetical protein
MEVFQGDPKLATYQQEINFIEEQIFNNAGYSPFKTKGQGAENYENKTASLFADKLDIETTKLKQSKLKFKLYKIFDMVLTYYDLNPINDKGERQYSLSFISINMIDTMTKTDELKKQLEMGIISPAEVRADIKGITLSQAKKDIEFINEELLEKTMIENELL